MNAQGDPAKKKIEARVSSLHLLRALNEILPDTGPGGYFGRGSLEAGLDYESKGMELIGKIARAQVRSWLEKGMGLEFGTDRGSFTPSVQIEFKKGRFLPNASLKWNPTTSGITSPLETEAATVRYLEAHLGNWGNNRSPNNNYVAGSTLSVGFVTASKTVYFDNLTFDGKIPVAGEAFTGPAPGAHDLAAWISLVNHGMSNRGRFTIFRMS